MAERVRAIMVGCGGISGAWLRPIAEIDEVEIVGMVDLNEDAARKRAEEYGLDVATGTDMAKMIGDLKPDAVFDLTVPEAHSEVTTAALDLGCHVLCEKPMADTMENARKMVEAAERAGKVCAVIQNRRYDPRIRRFRRFVASGEIGQLTTLNCDFYIGAHFGGFRAEMDHVLLLDMAIHTFDAARLISGADPVAVYAKDWNPEGSWYRHGASAVAIFEMTGGIVYTYRGSWCSDGCNTTWECDWRAIGTKGSATWDGADAYRAQTEDSENAEARSGLIWKMRDVGVPETMPDDASGAHGGLIREFARCVLEGGTPETVCTDNIKSLAMVRAAIESAETGRRVEVRV